MIALLETYIDQASPIERLRRRFSGDTGIEITEETVMGMPVAVFKIAMSQREIKRGGIKKLSRVMEALDRGNIHKVCFRSDFFMKNVIMDNAFRELDTKELWDIKAAEIAKKAAPKGASALLMSEKFGTKQEKTVERLSENFRYVSVASLESCAEFCRDMCERTGVSIIEKPAKNVVFRSDAAVIFDVPEKTELRKQCVAVSYGVLPEKITGMPQYVENVEFACSANDAGKIPEGYPWEQILSEAAEIGTLAENDIAVKSVKLSSLGDKNTGKNAYA